MPDSNNNKRLPAPSCAIVIDWLVVESGLIVTLLCDGRVCSALAFDLSLAIVAAILAIVAVILALDL